MKKQVAIIGLGRFGDSLASTLFNMGHDVLAIDNDEKKVQNIASRVTHAVQADGTNEDVLNDLGLANFEIAIVAIGTDVEDSVLSTILLKKIGVKYVIARANNKLHGTILEKIGANKVVYPEGEMGSRVAHGVTLTDVLDYMPISHEYCMCKMIAPSYISGRTLAGVGFGLENESKILVVLIQRGKEAIVLPEHDEIIRPDDILLLMGGSEKIEKIFAEARKKAEKKD
jgi:trk system potassium uptake protein TrkA